MSDLVVVGKSAQDVRRGDTQVAYSKVIINVAKDNDSIISYIAGNDTGTTLEFDCPWGTQAMADNILEKIRGYQYQPYNATTAIINPAGEIGDTVQANGVYGGLYQQDATFSHTFYSDISAPQEEQLNHEFTFESPIERRLSRQEAYSKSTFQIQHDNIEAKVSQKGGDIENNSFSWRLLADEFALYSGTKKVFSCVKSGISVDGEIKARSGYIGTDSNGFEINSKYIANGKDTYDSESDGVYLGTDGIGLGRNVFHVDIYGNLIAKSATISGTITAKEGRIGADENGKNGFIIKANKMYNGTASLSDTNAGIYLGTDGIRVYKNATNSFTVQANNGRVTILSGMASRDDTSTSTGMYLGYDGISLGGGKFKVTNAGTLYAKNGYIGSDDSESERWQIGGKSIYKGTDSLTSTTEGIYLGTNGIRVYKDATNSFTVQASNGRVTILSGMSSRDDTSTSTGMYFGYDGIALGGGKFKVTNAGMLYAKNGYIGSDDTESERWQIGGKNIHKGTDSLTSTTAGVYIGTDGIRLYKEENKNVTLKADGTISIMGGMTNIDDETNTSGFFLGNDGIVFGGGRVKITKTGYLYAKYGYIGRSDTVSERWEIGSKNIHNGTNSTSSTTVGIYLGTDGIRLYKNETDSVTIKSNGTISIMKGMTGINDTTNSTGFFFGNDGLALGGGKLKLQKSGALTATSATIHGVIKASSGKIGVTFNSDGTETGGFEIVSNAIKNGKTSYNETTNDGVYIGTSGIGLGKGVFYVDNKGDVTANNITIKGKLGGSNGFTVTDRKFYVNQTTYNGSASGDTAGVYVGTDGIGLGKDKFYVTSSGYLFSKEGDIAGWTIGTSSLSKLVKNGSTVTSNVGMSSGGTIAFYAGQNEDANNCAFKVSKSGQVWLTKLYARTVDTSAAGYDENDPSTWQWIDSQIDLGTNGFKIGNGYNTIAGYNASTGKVRLSNGQSFNTAASVKVAGGWGGDARYAYRAYYLNSSGSEVVVASGYSERVGVGFLADATGTYILANYGSSSGQGYETITSYKYSLEFSSTSYSSGTTVRMMSSVGEVIANSASLSLTNYWNTAQNSVTINNPTWTHGPSSDITGNSNTATFQTSAPTPKSNAVTIYLDGNSGSWSSGNKYVYATANDSMETSRIARTQVSIPNVSSIADADKIKTYGNTYPSGSLNGGNISKSGITAGKYMTMTLRVGGKAFVVYHQVVA